METREERKKALDQLRLIEIHFVIETRTSISKNSMMRGMNDKEQTESISLVQSGFHEVIDP